MPNRVVKVYIHLEALILTQLLDCLVKNIQLMSKLCVHAMFYYILVLLSVINVNEKDMGRSFPKYQLKISLKRLVVLKSLFYVLYPVRRQLRKAACFSIYFMTYIMLECNKIELKTLLRQQLTRILKQAFFHVEHFGVSVQKALTHN